MKHVISSPDESDFDSLDSILSIVITEKEVSQLPPGSIIIRSESDWQRLKESGGVVYVVGEEDHTVRPMTEEEKAAYRRYWERQGRLPPEDYDKPKDPPSA